MTHNPITQNKTTGRRPWRSSGFKNPSADVWDLGLNSGSGRSHTPQGSYAPVPQLLNPCSRACEPQLLKPERPTALLRNKRSHHNKKPAH